MSDRHTLDVLTRLTRVSTSVELAACLEEALLPLLRPSSLVLAWGRAHPQYALVPVYASPTFPESLLQSFRIADPFFAVPLLDSLNVDQPPRVEQLENLRMERDKLWWSVFRQRQFRSLSVAGSVDLRGKYLSYLCVTDANAGNEPALADLLAVLSPILHDTLGRIRREKKRLQKVNDTPLLTQREQEILGWVRRGKTNAEISAILGIAYPTIKNHVQKIMIKLRANNRTDAVAKALNAHHEETLAPNSWLVDRRRKES